MMVAEVGATAGSAVGAQAIAWVSKLRRSRTGESYGWWREGNGFAWASVGEGGFEGGGEGDGFAQVRMMHSMCPSSPSHNSPTRD